MSDAECNVMDSYKPFCSEVGVYSRGGTLRMVQCIRDTCSFQSIACRSMLEWYECSDTGEVRLIQAIFEVPVQVPLVKIDIEVNGQRHTVLCGLVDHLLNGMTLLFGNDYNYLFPLTVAVITRGQTKRFEHRPTGVNDDTVHEGTGIHVNGDGVQTVHDETRDDIQSNSSTELMVSGDARRNERRLQAINDVCVSGPEVCVSMSVGSDDRWRFSRWRFGV